MTSTIYADRHDDATASSAPFALKARRAATALFAFARGRIQGSPDLRLDDHLLQDIGLTRADYEALRG